uniref:Translocon at the inner envelope membrane of chloroplasts 214 n=1 Tax=Rhabdodendron amazonicum TaxID=63102 RepID=A0A411K597_9CARY|nr:hypothetical protein RF1 [Rhabdodendron amazonicum]QBC72506.1 hypothetical protein RF1 [Rhabdodendron amazonicum]
MIFQSFLLGNLVSVCMKIINSVVVVGLYYGFLTTFSIGPSYLFLLRAQVMEEGEEGTEKKVSATTGFLMGQLIMFISIYYTPLHLALGRPHTITVLALPYLLFHFFWNNHKFDHGSTSRNSMRNLSIQCVFLNNLIFQLFNLFILTSSMLARLVNIYMFRCNNKMLFVTSSFLGWLIGHIFFMKWVGLVLVWIRQNHSIRSNVLIRSNKYLVSELRNSMARIFSILLFITCVYYLGRMPSPILTKKLKETSETKERRESEEETDVEIEITYETKGTKQEHEGFTEEDPSPSFFSEEKEDPDKIDETEKIRVNGRDKTKDEFHFHLKDACYKNNPTSSNIVRNQDNSKLEILKEEDKDLFWFEKPLVTLLFDLKRWNRPFRYIKNNRFENAVRNEISQYFFYTCQNDGNPRISFTYPPSLMTFWEIIQRKMSLSTTDKFMSTTDKFIFDELHNYWISTNKQKRNSLSKEFTSRIEVLDKGLLYLDVLEKKTRLCNNKSKKEYLPKIYDPFLNGPYRGIIKKSFSPSIRNSILNETTVKILMETFLINKIHSLLLSKEKNDREFEHQKNTFDKTSKEMTNFFTFISNFDRESTSNLKEISLFPEQGRISSKDQANFLKILFDAAITDPFVQKTRKKKIGIKEISKKVPRWSYKLIDELEQEERENEEEMAVDHEIRSRKAKRVVIFKDTQQNIDNYSNNKDRNNPDQVDEVSLIRYSQQSDFRRDIIKGSMRVQRRKIVIWELFQANVHSPLFFDRIKKSNFFDFDISVLIKRIFQNWMGKNAEFEISDSKEEERKEGEKNEEYEREEDKRKEQKRIEIAEAWDTILIAQVIRGLMLVTHSFFRKYILLPFLIIAKNIGRILLFQRPEWSEDFDEWNREMHVKCTYNGVQLSENEFPKNWLTDGIQIKIMFPFCLKPWHRSKIQLSHRDPMKNKEKKQDFCFLTVWGMETELPFGSPRKRPYFFKPILKELEKKIRKNGKKFFINLRILKERTQIFLKVPNETKKHILTNFFFKNKKKIKLSKKNPIPVFGLREESSEIKKEKDSLITNKRIHKSSIQTRSMDWINSSLTEKKIKDLTDKTSTIKNKIERITKDKKKRFRTRKIKISPNQTSYGAKKLASMKHFFQILKRSNARLIRQLHFFIKYFMERIYIDIFLSIINITSIHIQLFIELKKNYISKYIYNYNNETTKERIDKTNQNTIQFISIIQKSLSLFGSNRNTNSKIFCDLSFLSQAYVFYKLSQTQFFHFFYLKSVLQYKETSFFLKKEIKDFFGKQGIIHYELRPKKLDKSGMNQWKNWLKSHYLYDLSQKKWSKLVTQKWRNRVNCGVEKTNLSKWDSYEKDPLIHYKKEKDSEAYFFLMPNQKDNLKKNYRHDLLSYKSIYYEDKKGSYSYGFPFKVNKKQDYSFTYNYNINKQILVGNIPIKNFLGKDNIIDIEKNPDRKFFDWRILNLNFCLRKKIDKKGLFFLTINQDINSSNQNKNLFDWMGMNEERVNHPISNLELWFFPEFVSLYNAYKKKPWVIPIKFLFFYLNVSENLSEKKNINRKKKKDPLTLISSNEKNVSREFENRNQEEKESSKGYLGSDAQNQGNSESVFSNQQKDIEEDYTGSDIKKRRKKKQSKSSTETELDFFLKRYLLFQVRWDASLNIKMINNIKVYCLLLRLRNPRDIAISAIERGELSLDIMLINKDLTLTKVVKKGILIIEPMRLSVKVDGKLIMYQTIGISLVHKSKHQKNQKGYGEIIDKKESIAKNKKMTKNGDKNHYKLLTPENIFSPRRRRELRILICFNSRINSNSIDKNPVFGNENTVKNFSQFLEEGKDLDRDKKKLREKNKLIQFKFFLWPNYRLEDLACMNRYWFDTNNGSRFSMLRIHMYPRLKNH